MPESIRAFLKNFTRERNIHPFAGLTALTRLFSSFDWFIVSVLGVVMALSLGATLASISMALTVEVPAHGGTYTEGVVGAPRFVNPVLAISEAGRDMAALVFSGLLKTEPDGSLSPDVASSYTISEDKRTYTFT